jgi:hypothetical protein
VILFASCITFVPISSEEIEIDHSVIPDGDVVEVGPLGYEEKKTGLVALFSSREKKLSPAEKEIFVNGSYEAQSNEPSPIFYVAYPKKNEKLAGQMILVNTYRMYFKWTGDILFSDKIHQANFLIEANAPKEGGKGKTILLDTAKNDFYRFEFSGPIGYMTFDADSEVPAFPWWVGDFTAGDKTYRLNAVVETGIKYHYPENFSGKAIPDDPFAYETRKNFFYPKQKFQIVDAESNTVLAEIHNNVYILYDTVPETEREAMKCNIGLFYAILQAAKKTDAGSSW